VRVLVTNDDGWDAPGIRALATAVRDAGHDVLVVAPDSDRSGAGAAIGPLHRSNPISFEEHSWPELPGVRVLGIDAPPATAVYGALLGGFGDPPGLVCSGVNPGANTGHLVLHSGTVGAALTAAGLGVPAIAASVAWGDDPHFSTAATLAAAAIDWIAEQGAYVLNLNAPDVELAEVRGVRDAQLAPYGEVWVADADDLVGDLKLEFKGRDREPDPETDLALVRAGFAAVTVLVGLEPVAIPGAAEVVATALAS
jgi:5'-nucleotidase